MTPEARKKQLDQLVSAALSDVVRRLWDSQEPFRIEVLIETADDVEVRHELVNRRRELKR